MSLFDSLAKQLNPSQLEAVQNIDGPLLILAGAGSGKTRVLTYRVANIIAQEKAAPYEILAVTFTNKAAREMQARTLSLLTELNLPQLNTSTFSGQLWINTFHSICARILRQQIHLLDYQSFFAIYNDGDQVSMIKRVLRALNINEKNHPAKYFKSRINQAKQLALEPDDINAKAPDLMDKRALEVYTAYEKEMKKSNALDFGDLLFKTYRLFQYYPDILKHYQEQFKYILVDEYQDTNHIQYLLIKLLAQEHRNLCVVGDEDQSIYSWRGADIQNILDFEKDFVNPVVIKLEQNYRSSKNIVEAASSLIKNNSQRKDKTLFTNNSDGELITIREEKNDFEEARYVIKTIGDIIATNSNNYNYSDFAIFYRTNAQSRVLEDQLRAYSIPYKLLGGIKFYERMEIKNILSYLNLILNPSDDVAFRRAVNTPARGIGKTTIEKIENLARSEGLSLFAASKACADKGFVNAGTARKLYGFLMLIDSFREEEANLKLSELYHNILDGTHYITKLKSEDTPEATARIDNLEEFNNAIMQFEQERGSEANLQSFLEEMALVSDTDAANDNEIGVFLMTLHNSKGLEFPNVFIVGAEEGLFPVGYDDDLDEIEEERRLAYVGMTRARERLFITYARSRRVWGQEKNHAPSRFISEIPEEYLKQETTFKKVQRRPRNERFESFDSMPDYDNFSDEPNEYAPGTDLYTKGSKIRHPIFGIGTIYGTEGSGDMKKVSIVFSNKDIRKFVIKYARLELL